MDPETTGGTPAPEVTFAPEQQAVLNALLKKERESTAKKYQQELAPLKEQAAAAAALQQKVAELEEHVQLAGKSAEEKERVRAEKESKKILGDLEAARKLAADADGALAAERNAHRMTRVNQALSSALHAANVIPEAADDAMLAMLRDSELSFDDTGNLTEITLKHDGTRHASAQKAAEAYLKTKTHFVKPITGGAGTPRGGSTPSSGSSNTPLHMRQRDELVALSVQERLAARGR